MNGNGGVNCRKNDLRSGTDGTGDAACNFALNERARERRDGEDFEGRSFGIEGIPRRPWRGDAIPRVCVPWTGMGVAD